MSKHDHEFNKTYLNLADIGLDTDELALMKVARHYFIAYTEHAHPHWETAMDLAQKHFGEVVGPQVGFALLNVLRTMRTSRQTTFNFSNPRCPGCNQKVSDCERLLFSTIRKSRLGDRSTARMEALILCEGFDVNPMLDAVDKLCMLIGEPYLEAQIPPATSARILN